VAAIAVGFVVIFGLKITARFYIQGMALLAGLYGFFMLFQGFMLVPSDFPDWLSWLYYVGPQTYAWRSFMVSEFRGDEAFEGSFATGNDVLTFYEIEDVNRRNDMVVLLSYAIVVHCLSFGILVARHTLFRARIRPVRRPLAAKRTEASPTHTLMTTEEPYRYDANEVLDEPYGEVEVVA
jgi:ABC-2 type transporter